MVEGAIRDLEDVGNLVTTPSANVRHGWLELYSLTNWFPRMVTCSRGRRSVGKEFNVGACHRTGLSLSETVIVNVR